MDERNRAAAPAGPAEETGGTFQWGTDRPAIGKEELAEAQATLAKYKSGKANLENRVVEDELWWELRHWEVIGRDKRRPGEARSTSAWLFNTLINKHADAMDNYPAPVVLPREQSDEESARILSAVLPVILEENEHEKVYSDGWWEKLKHGTAAYGVFWDKSKENGLGDISIRGIDLLKLFWEPGVTNLQDSRNLFVVELVDEDLLDRQYPQHKGKMGGSAIDVKEYLYDESIDVSGKSLVIDWYYKVHRADGRTVLHYVKFVGGMDEPLFASENDPAYAERGWYDHGRYPVVLDVLFPEKGTPAGFGFVAVCKDPQLYIDNLAANILENALISTRKRYFVSDSCGVNEEEFTDLSKPFVHVQGELTENRMREISGNRLDDLYVSIMNLKVEEMKDTSSNRDVNNGANGNVTAASAIAALQEAGNKTSRDMISASYRANTEIATLCVELIRQFYDEGRAFRVVGPNGYSFVRLDNRGLQEQQMQTMRGQTLYRRPVFDIKIKAQRSNPFSRMEQNERAKELYGLGFFNPDRAQEALGALEMMDFEGIDKVRERVEQGQTLTNQLQQVLQQMEQMGAALARLTGEETIPAEGTARRERGGSQAAPGSGQETGEGLAQQVMDSRTPLPGYAQRMVRRSKPNMEQKSTAAGPGQ